jgi:hypothetical protein
LGGSDATISPPLRISRRWSAMTSPIRTPWSSQRANTRSMSASRPGRAMTSIRSCDSLSITSYGVMPVARRGTVSTSMRIPTLLFAATSLDAQVSPAAPRSPIASTASSATSSSVASSSSFSRNGLPTWTDGRFAASAEPSSKLASSDAPAIPSRPVSEPTRYTALPGFAVAAERRSARSTNPTHIALTSGLSA